MTHDPFAPRRLDDDAPSPNRSTESRLDADVFEADEPLDMRFPDSAAAALTPAAIDHRLRRLGTVSESQARVASVLPWVASLGAHLAILAVGMAATWSIVRSPELLDPVLVVADLDERSYAPVIATSPRREVTGDVTTRSTPPIVPPSSAIPAEASRVAPAPRSAPTAIDWSPPVGEAISFAGVRADHARRVVYVVDASGSLVGALPIVIDELSRSLRSLAPEQQYAVIFFQRNEALMAPPNDRLALATPEQIERTLRWIRQRIVPAGRSNPMRAIESALRLRPDALFLLSTSITGSGQFEIAQSELLAQIDRLNPADGSGRRRAAIRCVQFLDPDPLDTLRRIAEAHGGPEGFRFLSRAELGVAPR